MRHIRFIRFLLAVALLGLAGGCGSPATPEQLKNEPLQTPGEITLYDRLGGGSEIYAITDNFLDPAIQDPRVNFQREGHAHTWAATPESTARLKLYWAQYIDMLVDGPQVYEGRNMMDTHRGMDISEGEWLALMEDFKQTLDEFKIPQDLQNELIARLGSTHQAVVSR